MTRMDLLKTNADIIKDVSGKVKSYGADAISIMVTNPLDLSADSSLEGYRRLQKPELWGWVEC